MAQNATATANVNVQANTQEAEAQINQLEGSIKVLDGAVNLVGGTLETLAGGLVLSGALSDEQAKKFEELAIGAIAFADGAKRTLDGVVNLKEGFSKLADSSKFAAAANNLLGKAIRFATGPIGIAIAAVVAITAILYKFRDSLGVVGKAMSYVAGLFTKLTDAIGLTDSKTDELIAKNKDLASQKEYELALAKAQGKSTDELIEKERELLKAKIGATKAGTEERKKAEQELSIFNAQVITDREKNEEEARKKAAEKRKAEAEKRKAEEKKAAEEKLKAEQDYLKMLDDLRKGYEAADAARQVEVSNAVDAILQKRLDAIDQEKNAVYEKYYALEVAAEGNAEALAVLNEGLQNELTEIDKKYAKDREKIASEEQKFKEQIVNETIDNFQGALTALFGESKAVASANVLIDAAQAAVGILASSQKFKDPTGTLAILYQVSQFALLAATTTASLRQINSAQPGSTGTPTTPKPSRIGGGAFAGALPGTGGAPTSGVPTQGGQGIRTEPIRAYVISQDVTNGQEANAAINRRRRLGG